MARKLPLDTLTDLARTQTDEAARRLGALQSARLGAGQKLELLLQYRQDYDDQLHQLMNKGLPTAQWRNFQAFLGTLDGAIEQQRAIVAQADRPRDGVSLLVDGAFERPEEVVAIAP